MRLLASIVCVIAGTAIPAKISSQNFAGKTNQSGALEASVFDPKAYGAVGDGVTDDTAAFADAIAHAAMVRGTVHIPAGIYVATIAVTKGGITMEGEGKDITTIKAPHTKAASTADRIVAVADSDGTIIKDLTIDGDKMAGSGEKPIGYALLLYQSSDCQVENVKVTNAQQIGIGISAGKRTTISNTEVIGSEWQNITTLNNRTGGCEGTVISNCRSSDAGYDSVQITAVGAVTVENCYLAGSPFSGVYVASGARHVTLRNNTITKCYSGIDMSWGTAGGAGTGPDNSEGNVIAGNRISRCENIGIGTASNGTIIINNSISDVGGSARPTYTLLGKTTSIASGGKGYKVGDVLTFLGGDCIKPAQVQVTAVDTGGAVRSITLPNGSTCSYLGVYTMPPSNPVSAKGGAGGGAKFRNTWNARALKCAGIAVIDAANIAIKNNKSGNSVGRTGQRYGVALLRQFTVPSHLTITSNTFSNNAVASVSPVMKAGGRAP